MWLNRYFNTWYCNWQVWEVTARTQAGFIPGTHSYSKGIEPRSPGYRRTQATRVALHGTVLLLCLFPLSSFNVNDPPHPPLWRPHSISPSLDVCPHYDLSSCVPSSLFMPSNVRLPTDALTLWKVREDFSQAVLTPSAILAAFHVSVRITALTNLLHQPP